MSAILPECVGYSPELRDAVVDVWNRAFHSLRNFVPFDGSSWRRRIEEFSLPEGADDLSIAGSGPTSFEPELLRIALHEGRVVGLAHGGTWDDAFLARLLPGGRRARVGTLLAIAVDPSLRGRGVGRALLADLEETLARSCGTGGGLRADGRGYNSFYGNVLAPVPPPWGTPEGIALPAEDAAARAFFDAAGFREDARATSRVRPLGDRTRLDLDVPPDLVLEEVENWQPILGTDDGRAFPFDNDSRTWLLRDGDRQLGALVAFPLSADGTRWGIHSFEVEASRRGEGLGRLLLSYAIAAIARRGVRELEALARPDEAPEADRLYARLDFAEVAEWIILS